VNRILDYLDPRDLVVSLCGVSQRLSHAAMDPKRWRRLQVISSSSSTSETVLLRLELRYGRAFVRRWCALLCFASLTFLEIRKVLRTYIKECKMCMKDLDDATREARILTSGQVFPYINEFRCLTLSKSKRVTISRTTKILAPLSLPCHFAMLERMAILPSNSACVGGSTRLSEYLSPGLFSLSIENAIDFIRTKHFDARRTMYLGLRLLGRWIKVTDKTVPVAGQYQITGVSLLNGISFKLMNSLQTEDTLPVCGRYDADDSWIIYSPFSKTSKWSFVDNMSLTATSDVLFLGTSTLAPPSYSVSNAIITTLKNLTRFDETMIHLFFCGRFQLAQDLLFASPTRFLRYMIYSEQPKLYKTERKYSDANRFTHCPVRTCIHQVLYPHPHVYMKHLKDFIEEMYIVENLDLAEFWICEDTRFHVMHGIANFKSRRDDMVPYVYNSHTTTSLISLLSGFFFVTFHLLTSYLKNNRFAKMICDASIQYYNKTKYQANKRDAEMFELVLQNARAHRLLAHCQWMLSDFFNGTWFFSIVL